MSAARDARQTAARLAELRALLNEDERERIDVLEKAGIDPAELSLALADAISLSEARDDNVARALAPTIEAGLFRSARRDPSALADAIHPALGPAIRSMIQATLRQSLEKLNVALENAFSPQGMRWRLQAARTGQSFSEVVLLNTLLYRVESTVLVHASTNLVIDEVHAEDAPDRDADLVAGMLGAIDDFAVDSLGNAGDERLNEIEFGGRTLILARGPSALVLLVARGNPPKSLHGRAQETVDRLHIEYGDELRSFGAGGDEGTHDEAGLATLVGPRLEDLLESKARGRKPNKLLRALPIGAAAILLGWLVFAGVRGWRRAQTLGELRGALEAAPGLVVTSAEVDGSTYVVRGLADPLAEPANVVARRAVASDDVKMRLEFGAYVSLDPAIVICRADAALGLGEAARLALRGTELGIWGVDAASPAGRRASSMAPFVPGVTRVVYRP